MKRLFFIILFFPTIVFSHELKPSIANFKFTQNSTSLNFELKIRTNLEAILANIDPSHSNTNESENSDYYDKLRALKSENLKLEFKKSLKEFRENIYIIQNDIYLKFNIDDIKIEDNDDLKISRETIIYISGYDIEDSKLKVGWSGDYGPLILRVSNYKNNKIYTEYLKINSISRNFSLNYYKKNNFFSTTFDYLIIGFKHIIPKGLDHILFIIGLFLFSPNFRPLIIQISMFTLAHTLTIFLGTLNILKIPQNIVEPIIALSISYIAVENIFLKKISLWRPLVVFFFGLLHGLGFAGVITEIGLSQTNFLLSLVSFNLGVELGQLFIILISYFGVAYWIKSKQWYKKFFTNPLSLIISVIGIYWFFERIN